jgi:superfamily II RNA helicase
MSVGINLPVKTTIFTEISKFNGEILRTLYSHEYTQAAGRAGRLGLDKIGHVIHLNNLFRNVDYTNYKLMMNNKPQTLMSKFKISYNMLLNLIDIKDTQLVQFANRSMVTGDLDEQMKQIYYNITSLNAELDNIKLCSHNLKTPIHVLQQFIDLQRGRTSTVNKKRKEIDRQLQQLHDNYKSIENDKITYQKIELKEGEINVLQNQYDYVNSYIYSGVNKVLTLLKEDGFICNNLDDSTIVELTVKGKIACHLREVHCLVFAKLLEDKNMDNLSSKQLVSLFSIFTNINVQDDLKDNCPKINDENVLVTAKLLTNLYDDYKNKESEYNINTGLDYTIHYDLLKYTAEWCDCDDVESCKLLLQKMTQEKEIFLGEFVKALLKINNISSEMEKIAELTGNIAFLSKLKEIPNITLKYVVTNQSLYV